MGIDFEKIKFNEAGLLPVIVQDTRTREVLMMAWMNREALEKTLTTRQTWFWSRSRQKIWHKGEQSGHVQHVEEIYHDCDADTLLIKASQTGAACHEGYRSCFHYRIDPMSGSVAVVGELSFDPEQVYNTSKSYNRINEKAHVSREKTDIVDHDVLKELYGFIQDRKLQRPAGTYTTYLFERGLDKILKKIGEETTEMIVSAKNSQKNEVVHEAADLFYHILVLLAERDVHLEDVLSELAARR